MNPAAWQFVAVLGLIAAWVTALRWSKRTNADRPFRYDSENAPPADFEGSGLVQAWRQRPRPIVAWLDQPVTRRRLQALLAHGLATVLSMFMAIAFGGEFVRLFLVMVVISIVFLTRAVMVGNRELREMEMAAGRRRHPVASGYTRGWAWHSDVVLDAIGADDLGLASRLYQGDEELADDHEMEVPLIFEPLNFEEIFADLGVRGVFADLVDELDDDEPDDHVEGFHEAG